MLIPEFAPQSGVALTWPHSNSDWQATLAAVIPVYVEIARAITQYQRLLVICYDRQHHAETSRELEQAGVSLENIMFSCIPSNDTWIRDYGPLVTAGIDTLTLQNFTFDGWGGKFPAGLDNGITKILHASGMFEDLPLHDHAMVLEGGSIDCDGRGTLLTTSRCLLENGRNPGFGREEMNAALCTSLGMDQVLWLDHGEIIGDDTDGHVDMLARFCSPDTIAYTSCERTNDAHHAGLARMAEQLHTFTSAAGNHYRLVPLPLPAPLYDTDNRRLPASYANFLIVNDAVLMPAYDDPADAQAARALSDCFPDREIIAVNCLPLISQSGSLHCATLHLPAGVLANAHE